jgi:hypothetical protein
MIKTIRAVGLFAATAFSLFAADPIRLDPGVAQLFVDDELIAESSDLKRTLHSPTKDGGGQEPVIALTDEFEDYPCTLEANGTIVYDVEQKRYVMYCIGFSPQWKSKRAWDCVRLYRFTSPDGLQWRKGDDGASQCVLPRSPDDLLDKESGASATYLDMFSCFYDVTDLVWPYKGWQHFANWGDDREGVYYMQSRDGIVWERGPMVVNGVAGKDDPSARRIEVEGRRFQGPGDVTLFSHDAQTGKFLGLFKFYSPDALPNGNLLRSRAYAWLERLDVPFDTEGIATIDLVPAGEARNGDLPADEYYASSAWRYGSQWLGGLKIFHHEDDYPWSANGCAFLKLVSSRDGLHWSKISFPNEKGIEEVWLANGTEGGNGGRNDGGYMTEFSQGPMRVDDELIYYYGSSSFGKNAGADRRISGGGIFRARLRLDGFVSVDAGTLTTKPLISFSPTLSVNAVGPAKVEVLDLEGRVRSTAEITGDSLGHPVPCGSEPFCLRFTVEKGGRLYGFAAAAA